MGLSGPGLTASFTYDALGRRTGKTVNGKSLTYLYDGSDIVAESGGATAAYTHGPGVDEPLVRRSSADEYYLSDALGSVVALSDDTGAIRTSYNYSPFGLKQSSGTLSENPFTFTAREDDATGLYYYRARYYSPDQKRFLSEDPLGSAGGDSNLYAYVGNDPVNRTDPSGLIWDTIADVGFIALDLYRLTSDGECNRGENLVALGLDVAGALLPFATGLGAASRAEKAAERAAELGKVAENCLRPNSFTAGTLVTTEQGHKRIEEVQVGERVLARNEQTGEQHYQRVTQAFSHGTSEVYALRLKGAGSAEELGVTGEHPFWVKGKGWTEAKELKGSESVASATGQWLAVESLHPRQEQEKSYNLEVETDHSFFVGNDQAWVHNSCPELGRKLDFFLGQATGNDVNIQRSQGMLRQLESIGLFDNPATRESLARHMDVVLNDASNVARVQTDGRVVKDSLFSGPNGIVKLETIWEGSKLITGKIFGGR